MTTKIKNPKKIHRPVLLLVSAVVFETVVETPSPDGDAVVMVVFPPEVETAVPLPGDVIVVVPLILTKEIFIIQKLEKSFVYDTQKSYARRR